MKRLFALLLALCLTAGAGALAQEGVLLVGEQHSVPAILDRELELWDALYHEQGARHLFVELPYYTAQLLNEWMAQEGDALLCISTSGNAKNVCAAAEVARALDVFVLGLTGETGGRLRALCDCCICVPERETFKVQELHLPVYHYLCAETEAYFFEK